MKIKSKKGNQLSSNSNKKKINMKKAFRSPPLPKQLKNSRILKSYSSTGKLCFKDDFKPEMIIDIKKSIKTPKINTNLYEKYTGKVTELEEGLFVNSNCLNHSNKKSKFYTDKQLKYDSSNSRQKFYQAFCSKCAVQLVKNGVNCQEILNQEEKHRKILIEQLGEKLCLEKNNCLNFKEILSEKLKSLETFNDEQLNMVNSFYMDLLQKLEEKRIKTIDLVKSNFLRNRKIIKSFIKKVNKDKNVFDSIYNDIEENFDSIIKNIEMQPFQTIIQKYDKKLRDFRIYSEKLKESSLDVGILKYKINPYNVVKKCDPMIFMNLERKNIIPPSNFDTLANQECDYSAEKSENKDIQFIDKNRVSKSDVYVSFDEKNFSEKLAHSEKNQKYFEILNKINTNQKAQQQFYNSLLKKEIVIETDKAIEQEDKTKKPEEQNEQVFEIQYNQDENWQMKQTPDLGEKLNPPNYLQNHLENLQRNCMNNKINKNINENLVSSDVEEKPIQCQKELFNN